MQTLHRLRAARIAERTALCNQLRGLLTEYGVVLPQGVHVVRRGLPDILEDAENGLSEGLRRLLARGYEQLCQLDEHIGFYTAEVKRQLQTDEAAKRLETIPGFGPIVASVFHGVVGNGQAYLRGRDVAAGGMSPPLWDWSPVSTVVGVSHCC